MNIVSVIANEILTVKNKQTLQIYYMHYTIVNMTIIDLKLLGLNPHDSIKFRIFR